jgi:uncharacterized membrane protein
MEWERGTIVWVLAGVVGIVIPFMLVLFGNCEFFFLPFSFFSALPGALEIDGVGVNAA